MTEQVKKTAPAKKRAPAKSGAAKAPKAKTPKTPKVREQGKRKVFRGRVVSDARNKTIAVAVAIYIKHPLYGKRFRKVKKFHAHDEKEVSNVGDLVEIVETRPLSKTKAFRLVSVVEVAKRVETADEKPAVKGGK